MCVRARVRTCVCVRRMERHGADGVSEGGGGESNGSPGGSQQAYEAVIPPGLPMLCVRHVTRCAADGGAVRTDPRGHGAPGAAAGGGPGVEQWRREREEGGEGGDGRPAGRRLHHGRQGPGR